MLCHPCRRHNRCCDSILRQECCRGIVVACTDHHRQHHREAWSHRTTGGRKAIFWCQHQGLRRHRRTEDRISTQYGRLAYRSNLRRHRDLRCPERPGGHLQIQSRRYIFHIHGHRTGRQYILQRTSDELRRHIKNRKRHADLR